MTKIKILKQVIGLYTFIFLVWGCYRFLFRLPSEIEELIIKPLVWLLPVFWILKGPSTSLRVNLTSIGWRISNLFKSLYLGIGLGIIFAVEGLIANNLKYGQLNLVKIPSLTSDLLIFSLFVSLVTAVCEETVFRGFIFSRLSAVFKNEWLANIISSLGWVLIHLPIAIFVLHYLPAQIAVYLLLIFVFGFASCLVYGQTKTILASVLLNLFWAWPINLFR